MNDRIGRDTLRTVRAPRGATLNTANWRIEAPLRMLMNNLDPEVAERPDELIVYGGIGKAARNSECYDRIVATLKRLRRRRRCSCNPASRSASSARTRSRRASSSPTRTWSRSGRRPSTSTSSTGWA